MRKEQRAWLRELDAALARLQKRGWRVTKLVAVDESGAEPEFRVTVGLAHDMDYELSDPL